MKAGWQNPSMPPTGAGFLLTGFIPISKGQSWLKLLLVLCGYFKRNMGMAARSRRTSARLCREDSESSTFPKPCIISAATS